MLSPIHICIDKINDKYYFKIIKYIKVIPTTNYFKIIMKIIKNIKIKIVYNFNS